MSYVELKETFIGQMGQSSNNIHCAQMVENDKVLNIF